LFVQKVKSGMGPEGKEQQPFLPLPAIGDLRCKLIFYFFSLNSSSRVRRGCS